MAPDPHQNGPSQQLPSKKTKKDEKKDEDLSEEDLALKQQLELYVERAQDSDPGVQKLALESMRNLAGEIGHEYQNRQMEDKPFDDLMELVKQIVPFHAKHNAEPEAVDLLMEVESLDMLIGYIEKANYKRTCAYLTSLASYVPEKDDIHALEVAFKIYMKFEQFPDNLRVAQRKSGCGIIPFKERVQCSYL